ncbi:RNA-directed DNA polymerase, eukaryota, reverse transcriptase zinc-binding domain protein, partial [Tanacetum coccineum]
IAAIVSKLDNLGRHMKKLKENLHAIQVGCQKCGGAHLDKDCPLNKEVKSVKEAKYGEFKQAKLGGAYEQTHVGINVKKSRDGRIGIVENVFVKIDKFLFPSDFMVMDMLNTHNETMILGRPFLATIHAEINVFNKEISLGVRGDRERRSKKTRMLKTNTNLPSTHFCKPVKQICNGILKVWPTCDPTLKACNGGIKVYGMNEEGNPKRWYCYLDDDRGSIKGGGLSFPKFLLVKYGEVQKEEEDYKPRPKDYSFKDWLLTKVEHTEVSKPVKKALLKTWLLDCFQEELVKDPWSRSFDNYKWMFDLEVDQLAEEYELGIGKKGHMLDAIWANCKKVQGDNTYWWHDQKSEEEERRQLRINIKEYDPPMVHIETFKIKRYSFDTGQNFICVTKELMDALPLGRENGSRFRDMIRKEVDSGRRIHIKT